MSALQYALDNSTEERKEYPQDNCVSITRTFIQSLKMQRLISGELHKMKPFNTFGITWVWSFNGWTVSRHGREIKFRKTEDLN